MSTGGRNSFSFSIEYLLSTKQKEIITLSKTATNSENVGHPGDNFKLENLLKKTIKDQIDKEPANYSVNQNSKISKQGMFASFTQRNLYAIVPRNWHFRPVLQPSVHFQCSYFNTFKNKIKKTNKVNGSKRCRTAFTQKQLKILENSYIKDHYLVGEARKSLARDLHLTEVQVKVWFQNRRTKDRRKIVF